MTPPVSGAPSPRHLDVIVDSEVARGNTALGWRDFADQRGAWSRLRFADELDLEAIAAEFEIPTWIHLGVVDGRAQVSCDLSYALIEGARYRGKVRKRPGDRAWWERFDPTAAKKAIPIPAMYTPEWVAGWVEQQQRELAALRAAGRLRS